MDAKTLIILFVYFIIISAVGIFMTIKDKSAAKFRGKRVAESTLISLGFLGAAFPMFVTMNIIHHKTKHAKFMLGLPLYAILHIAIVGVIIYFVNKVTNGI